MKLYLGGKCLRYRLLAMPSPQTFIAVVDNPLEKTMDEALYELSIYLSQHPDYKDFPVKAFTSTSVILSDNTEFTVAHELDIDEKNNTSKYVVSNLLRHCFNELFLSDSLYIDDAGAVIDLSGKGVKTIQEQCLDVYNKNIFPYLNNKPDVVIDILEAFIVHHFYASDSLSRQLRRFQNLPKIEFTEANSSRLQQIFSFDNIDRLARFVNEYPYVLSYLNKTCGLNISIAYSESNIKELLLYDKSYAKNEDRPKYKFDAVGMPIIDLGVNDRAIDLDEEDEEDEADINFDEEDEEEDND